MSLFRSLGGKSKKLEISEKDPVYKVRYLGNVQTALMKGDGCVDKPTSVLWNNYLKNSNVGLEMKLTVSASGLKAVTKEQGLTEYRSHRISYGVAHPKYPKLFVWVYRHEGKKMKVELRCHAVLCKTDAKAKALAVKLHEKLSFALTEFMKEKTRRQNTRLALQRTSSSPSGHSGVSGMPNRKKFLSLGQNFKPANNNSASAPKLGDISEGVEEEYEEEEEEEEDLTLCETIEEDEAVGNDDELANQRLSDQAIASPSSSSGSSTPEKELVQGLFELEIGNDIEALKRDELVQYHLSHDDSDADSSESGFSEQDSKESSSAGSANGHGSASAGANGSHSAALTSSAGSSNGVTLKCDARVAMGAGPASALPLTNGTGLCHEVDDDVQISPL